MADVFVLWEDVQRDKLYIDEAELVADAEIFVGLDHFQDFIAKIIKIAKKIYFCKYEIFEVWQFSELCPRKWLS